MVVIVAGLILAVLVVMFAYGLGAIFYGLLVIIGLAILGYTINYRLKLKELQLEVEREERDNELNPPTTRKEKFYSSLDPELDNKEASKKLKWHKETKGETCIQLWWVYAFLVIAVVVIQIYCEFLADKFL